MKIKDLKVGEEYACFMRPSEARRRYRYSKPFRARLVDTAFSEVRWVHRSTSWHGSYSEERTVGGIAVDTGKKVFVKAEIPQRLKDGKFKMSKPNNYGSRHIITKPEQFSYDYVVLENAGCFLMPWAEWEAQEKARKEADDRHARLAKAQREKIQAESSTVEARVDVVLARLAELAGPEAEVRKSQGYVHQRWYSVDVFTPNPAYDDDNDKPGMKSIIHGEYKYGTGEDGEQHLVRVTFTTDDEALAQLLGVEVTV